MGIEEAIDILENIIDDEVIGIYCMEIQKRGVNCDENCKDKDCYLSEAISTIIRYIEQLEKEIDNLIKENHKHIDYIADMKKKHEDKIRTKIKELEKQEIKNTFTEKDKKRIAKIEVLEELLGNN